MQADYVIMQTALEHPCPQNKHMQCNTQEKRSSDWTYMNVFDKCSMAEHLHEYM